MNPLYLSPPRSILTPTDLGAASKNEHCPGKGGKEQKS